MTSRSETSRVAELEELLEHALKVARDQARGCGAAGCKAIATQFISRDHTYRCDRHGRVQLSREALPYATAVRFLVEKGLL